MRLDDADDRQSLRQKILTHNSGDCGLHETLSLGCIPALVSRLEVELVDLALDVTRLVENVSSGEAVIPDNVPIAISHIGRDSVVIFGC